MCGIAGILAYSNRHYRVEEETLKNMRIMMRHRGPDGEGSYITPNKRMGLAHVRLSIIDLETGHQPMLSSDKKLVISFNGEIYGYKETRKNLINKGHTFLSNSDTEVILNMYKDKGLDFIDDLHGEFAFGLWDSEEERLIIARDRFGVKPLYYTINNGILRFASEIKGIFGDREVKRQFNLQTIVEQMMRADSAARTTFSNINILPPGHMMIIQNEQIEIKKYWDIKFPEIGDYSDLGSMEYYADKLGTLLKNAVKKRMVSDVEVGCFLSGGLDSSIVAMLMQECSSKPIKTFSIGFKDKFYDESYYSKMVADSLGTDHHCLMLSHQDLALAFPQANYHCEHLVQQIDGAGKYLLSKYAKQFVKVVQVGEGADEITIGYPWFKTAKLLNYWNEGRASNLRNIVSGNETARKGLDLTISNQSNHDKVINRYGYYPLSIDNIVEMEKIAYPLFNRDVIGEVSKIDTSNIYFEDLDYEMIKKRYSIQQNRYEFIKKTFHTYLMQYLGGKNEMANSIEGRLPFLDNEFYDFAKDIHPSYHLFGLREKNLLRMAFKDKLPDKIINRVKHGYSAPILSNFLGENAPEYFKEFLSESNLKKTGLFDHKMVNKFISISQSLDYSDQRRTLYERAVVFVLSVQLMNDMFIENLPLDGKAPVYL